MKVLLMALNSKYIHSNLAIRSIEKYWQKHRANDDIHVILKEYTINNQMDYVLEDMFTGDYDVIVASTYIWNVEPLVNLFSNYKKINQKTLIFLGGPEADAMPEVLMGNHDFVEGILVGEGEAVFTDLIQVLSRGQTLNVVNGLVYREGQDIVTNPKRAYIEPMDQLAFPYDDLEAMTNRIIYYESSRGCPYQCSYCLSAGQSHVRHLSVERTTHDLQIFLDANVPQVKFIDRTFNLDKRHALPILDYLVAHDNGITNFHFEVTGSLLDDDYFAVLSKAREGLFQFEIGVQTTHDETMFAIHRPLKLEQLFGNIGRLLRDTKVHIHLDLIAGLPYESYERFLKSFDDVFMLYPHQLQLGFLKILKGTPIYHEVALHDYKIRNEAPYEVLSNRYITPSQMFRLKDLETVFEWYYNSGKFKHSIAFCLEEWQDKPHVFFLKLTDYVKAIQPLGQSVQSYTLYEYLFDFYNAFDGKSPEVFRDMLKFDYYACHLKSQRPLFYYHEMSDFNQMRLNYLRDNSGGERLSGYGQMTAKQILKTVEFITLRYDIINCIENDYQNAKERFNIVMFDYNVGYHELEQSKYTKLLLDVEERVIYEANTHTP